MFLVLFELRRSSSSHSQNLFLTVVSWSFLETIFQYFHVNAVEQEGTDLEVFRRGANFDKNTGKWARKYRKHIQICRVLTYKFSTFPENMSKTYIFVYVFWSSGSPFSRKPCHTPKPCKCGRTGRSGFRAFSRLFSRPAKYSKYDNNNVGFLGGVFKNTGFRENVLNPLLPVRPLLEAFCVSRPAARSGVRTNGRTEAQLGLKPPPPSSRRNESIPFWRGCTPPSLQ